VPVAFFQALGKTERDSGQSEKSPQAVRLPDHDSGYSDTSGSGTLVGNDGPRMSKTMKGTGAMVYGIVMYDFAAERPDELEAKAGEAIIVIAQSNPEWFVAKPIGRLGGPGLIPVSFIEIRDMTTGQAVPDAQEAVQRAGVPKVEEWKKMAADYKNSSITLGKFEANSQQQQSLEQGMDRMSLQQGSRQSQTNGQGYVSDLRTVSVSKLILFRHSRRLDNPSKPGACNKDSKSSRTPISRSLPLNSTRLSLQGYHDIVLRKTNTGSSLKLLWKMVGIGNCLATTRISMTFR
jgi:hypothetical protein